MVAPYVFSIHALQELERRNIPHTVVVGILDKPEQIIQGKENRTIYKSRLDSGEGKIYLVRVIVAPTVDSLLVITVYRTSKIQKYWRT